MKNIALGLLGPILDDAKHESRMKKWRPSVALCQFPELPLDEYHLVYQSKFKKIHETVVKDIKQLSPKTKILSHPIILTDPWDLEEVYSKLYDLTRKLQLPHHKNNYYIHMTTGTHISQICLYLLAEAKFLPGKLIQTVPPKGRDKLPGSFVTIDLDLKKYKNIFTRFKETQNLDLSFLKSGIPTKNTKFNDLIQTIEEVAINSSAPILLTGPTGAGKSQLAKKIFELKKQRAQVAGSFIEVNCATLRGDAAMSALFGHSKGSFTGATKDRTGFLKLADNGVLFLDEIGELGLDEQAMLLRAIEEKCFYPHGSESQVSSSFQLIAGTNKELRNNKGFRDDLLARINLWTFELPALKDRLEDIEPNIMYELQKFIQENAKNIKFQPRALKEYLDFAESDKALWKGNFRDLSASIQRMSTLSSKGIITSSIVENEIARLQDLWKPVKNESVLVKSILEEKVQQIDPFDLAQIEYVLSVCKSSQSLAEAGRKLFKFSRQKRKSTNDSDRLKKYLDKFGISWSEIK